MAATGVLLAMAEAELRRADVPGDAAFQEFVGEVLAAYVEGRIAHAMHGLAAGRDLARLAGMDGFFAARLRKMY